MSLKHLLFIVVAASLSVPALSQLVKVDTFAPHRADTILIERNWRTRSKIILAELEFNQGDTVTPQDLEVSLKKIWNLQNFATVDYRWDSLPDGRSALHLITRDALTIIPIIGGDLSKQGLKISAGLADKNFLGRNISLAVRGQYGENEPSFGEILLTIPRQLLWKNMSIGAGVRRESVYDVDADQAFVSIVNPLHQDYHYTFSPDLETGYYRLHPTALSLEQWPESPDYNRQFWYFRITESVGTITHRRHQEEGFNLTGMIGAGIGLNQNTQNYYECSVHAEYDKLLNPRLQLGLRWQGSYNSGPYFYFVPRYGPSNIRGIAYGDLTGNLMQLASAGLYYTWINRDYLAVEQSVFAQLGSASGRVRDPKDVGFRYAIGTGFQFTIPMYPAASLLISFSYNPSAKNWLYFEF